MGFREQDAKEAGFVPSKIMLFSQESNMLAESLFATGFGAFGCFDGGIATDENGQNGAEGTTDLIFC